MLIWTSTFINQDQLPARSIEKNPCFVIINVIITNQYTVIIICIIILLITWLLPYQMF